MSGKQKEGLELERSFLLRLPEVLFTLYKIVIIYSVSAYTH